MPSRLNYNHSAFTTALSHQLHQLHHATPHLALEADLVFAPTTCEHGAVGDTAGGPPLLMPPPPDRKSVV